SGGVALRDQRRPGQDRRCLWGQVRQRDPSRVGVPRGLRLRLWHGLAGGAGDVRHSALHGSGCSNHGQGRAGGPAGVPELVCQGLRCGGGMPLRHAHGGRLRRGAQGVEEVRRCLGADSEGRREERLQ
ncbi:unnamed protein product, partial [Effrenium voratum]